MTAEHHVEVSLSFRPNLPTDLELISDVFVCYIYECVCSVVYLFIYG